MRNLIFDGSFYGLLTAIYDGFYLKCDDLIISDNFTYKYNFLNIQMTIKTSDEKALKVYKAIEEKLGNPILENIYYLYLYEIDDAFTLIFKYLKLCFKYGSSINLAKNNDIIILVDKFIRRITLEAHRFTGFVRFKEVYKNTFYSKISPDYNILPLIIGHFKNRFKNQNFIIHDTKRELAIIYNMKEAIIVPFSIEQGDSFYNKNDDSFYSSLWKSFYKSTDIIERLNPKCFKRNLPKKYWNNMTELKN